MTNYYFYIVQNLRNRLGFGIAKDYFERNKQYSAHSGDIITFPLLYAGPEMKCKALERQFKKYTIDDIWLEMSGVQNGGTTTSHWTMLRI